MRTEGRQLKGDRMQSPGPDGADYGTAGDALPGQDDAR